MKRTTPPAISLFVLACIPLAFADLPASFDLRNYNGHNYVTSVKNQQGGTCWTFGAMAALEGNLALTGVWAAEGESGEPALAEYHLDWWNGFNQHNNDDLDPPTGFGLEVHYGGDYRVTAGYLTRGEGAVRDIDGQSYPTPPHRWKPTYHRYYAREIAWLTAGPGLANIGAIKQAVIDHGVVGTCMAYNDSFMWNYCHYQPPANAELPNHAVAIVGWDDAKVTQAPQPGAWLCKNSWGGGWGLAGYFWISYHDKYAGQHPEMGAVSFRNVERFAYDYVYYHDYHGWRDTLSETAVALNAFQGRAVQHLRAISFYTAADNVTYTARVYGAFDGIAPGDLRAELTGTVSHTGFHTFDLPDPLLVVPAEPFYLYLELSAGGQPYDRGSEIPVLLCGGAQRVWVDSAAAPGQSFYFAGGGWQDLTGVNASANFCIKALATNYYPLAISFPQGVPEYLSAGVINSLTVRIEDGAETLVPASARLHFRTDGAAFAEYALQPLGDDLFEARLPVVTCGQIAEFYVSAVGSGGTPYMSPPDAPLGAYRAFAGDLIAVAGDDFETDQGWAVVNQNLSTGAWERGVPVGGGLRGDPPTDFDGSGACYLTGNAPGDSDVDGGPTRLLSPVFDLSGGGQYRVRYARWFTNDNQDVDRLEVEVSNNSGASWLPLESVADTPGWVVRSLVLNDYIAPTSGVRLRFSVKDVPSNSVTEAALDAFAIETLVCTTPPGLGDVDCDGDVDFGDINPFVLALSGPAQYALEYPGCPLANRDVNEDGVFDFGDINAFVGLLSSD